MTLFRKVFQNQSRPADAEETLDEDALRAAFKEMRETREPLLLDPFEHAADNSDVEPEAPFFEQASAISGSPGLIDFAERVDGATGEYEEDTDTDGMPDDAFEAEMGALERDLDPSCAAPGTAVKLALPPAQSDDDIVANLGRVLADAPFQPDPPLGAEDDEDLIEEDLNAMDDPDVNPVDDPVDIALYGGALEENVSETVIDTGADEPALDRLAVRDATAAFAQQQMAALASPTAPQVEDLPAAEGATPVEDLPVVENATPVADATEEVNLAAVPAPAAGRAGRRTGRAKTRVLGFNRGEDAVGDPFGATPDATATPQSETFPVGWLVIVEVVFIQVY